MQSITVYKGDYGFDIPFALKNYDATATDLTGYVPRFKVWAPDYPSITFISASTTIDTASTGLCHYTITSTDLTVTGTFNAEIELYNSTSAILQTWDQFTLVVKESP